MILSISDNRTVSDLQDKFNECFPYLNIEFYDLSHNRQQSFCKENRIGCNIRMGELRRIHSVGILDIKSWYKVGRVEQDFKNIFGLDVQILFLKNNRWVRLSSSNDLTLAQASNMCNTQNVSGIP